MKTQNFFQLISIVFLLQVFSIANAIAQHDLDIDNQTCNYYSISFICDNGALPCNTNVVNNGWAYPNSTTTLNNYYGPNGHVFEVTLSIGGCVTTITDLTLNNNSSLCYPTSSNLMGTIIDCLGNIINMNFTPATVSSNALITITYSSTAISYFTKVYGSSIPDDWCTSAIKTTGSSKALVTVGYNDAPQLYFLSTDTFGNVLSSGTSNTNGTVNLFNSSFNYNVVVNDVVEIDPSNELIAIIGHARLNSSITTTSWDIFIMVLDVYGNIKCIKTYDNNSNNDYGMAINVDPNGNIYATGYTEHPISNNIKDAIALKFTYSHIPPSLPTLILGWDKIYNTTSWNSISAGSVDFSEKGLDIIYNPISSQLLMVGESENIITNEIWGICIDIDISSGGVVSSTPSFTNALHGTNSQLTSFRSVKFNSNNNSIMIAGTEINNANSTYLSDFALTEIDNTGAINYFKLFDCNNSKNEKCTDLLVTQSGDPFISGHLYNSSTYSNIVLCPTRNSEYTRLPYSHISSSGFQNESGTFLTEDPNQNYIFAHYSQGFYNPFGSISLGDDLTLTKLSYSGRTICDYDLESFNTTETTPSIDIPTYGETSGFNFVENVLNSYNLEYEEEICRDVCTTVTPPNLFTTSIKKMKQFPENSVFCFPTVLGEDNKVKLSIFSDKPIQSSKIVVIDNLGRIVKEEFSKGLSEISISIGENISTGIYYINYSSENTIKTFKVIKY